MKRPLEDKPMWIQAICYMLFGFVVSMTAVLVFFAAKDALHGEGE